MPERKRFFSIDPFPQSIQPQLISFLAVGHRSDPSDDDDDDDCSDYDLSDDDIGTSDQLHKEWSCIQEAWATWQLSFPSHWLTLPSGLLQNDRNHLDDQDS